MRSASVVAPVVAFVMAAMPALVAASCGARHETVLPDDAGGTLSDVSSIPRLDAPLFPEASCAVEIDSPPLMTAQHVPIGSDITWDSNPPSSGPHYPIWAAYQAYATPVPRGYYVHDLEHGAVVLLYNCPGDGGCPDVVAALQAASDAIADDPLCAATGQGVRVRTVITPDPLLDVPVAAAAWGWVYKAQCADLPTLQHFAIDHYGQGPEVLCAQGTTQF
ncbi:MAG TPA: DUF3105 domain-containing protein [Polyangiaceae bacterium]